MLGGMLNNLSDYLAFSYEKEKMVMVMVLISHFVFTVIWFYKL